MARQLREIDLLRTNYISRRFKMFHQQHLFHKKTTYVSSIWILAYIFLYILVKDMHTQMLVWTASTNLIHCVMYCMLLVKNGKLFVVMLRTRLYVFRACGLPDMLKRVWNQNLHLKAGLQLLNLMGNFAYFRDMLGLKVFFKAYNIILSQF